MRQQSPQPHRDRGSALPLTLVITIVLALVVVGIARYSAASLRFGRVAEDRSDRLSAADAGMRYAIDQLKLRNAGCILDTQEAVLPGVDADFNDATAAVVCERVTNGFEGIAAYAAVMTGEGLSSTDALLLSAGGASVDKVLGGPVFMSTVEDTSFALNAAVRIENGPLLYYDSSGTVPCSSKKPNELAPVSDGDLVFSPELIFGPICVTVPWTDLFDSPEVPDLTTLTIRDGAAPLTDPNGSYQDISGAGGCRVFEPGRYITPPDVQNRDSYFRSGVYLVDLPAGNETFEVVSSVVTAGGVNPLVSSDNEIGGQTNRCLQVQDDDESLGLYGATFYLTGGSHIVVRQQGALEVHALQQGTDYVSIQALCDPDPNGNGTPEAIEFETIPGEQDGYWCNADGDGGTGTFSTLTAPAPTSLDTIIYTREGNNREIATHALVYAPLAEMEFGNATNTADQKLLGGLIVARLKLQSSASATNFEISVPTSPITAKIQLTSNAYKRGKTTIRAVVEYRPYEDDIDDRVRINSWRVCDIDSC